jgi:chromosome partitioning protein
MTLSILIANPKGGCGKTTIATNLAAAFAQMGLSTALADCDRQKSAMAWLKRRPDHARAVHALNWTKAVGPLPDGLQRLVIDAPAAIRRDEVRDLIRRADVIVIPVLPSLFDELATRRFLGVLDKLKPIRNNKRAIAIVGNRVRTRSAANTRLEAFLTDLGHKAVATLRDTQAYPASAIAGLSIFDMAGRRIEPLLTDWQPLLRFISRAAANRGH